MKHPGTGIPGTDAQRGGALPLGIPLGEEQAPPGEAAQIDQLIAIHRDIQERVDRKQQPVPRGQHPKQHGCVYAEFTTEPGLAPEFRHGVFCESRMYPAVIRFSNARQHHDALPDAHGMAIKLFDVSGPRLLHEDLDAATQDFVLVDHPVFFLRNVAEGVPLLRAFLQLRTGGIWARSKTIVRGLLSQRRAFQIMRAMALKRPAHLLDLHTWSTTPIKLGGLAVKLAVRPLPDPGASARDRSTGRDHLRRSLADHLAQHEARFEFLVQEQLHPITMPVEDPTVEWDEEASPFQRVAIIRIPPQTFEAPGQLAFGENLSFTPWHGLQDHRPLGGINRARRRLYAEMAARRRTLNGVPTHEPTLAELRVLWPGFFC